MFHIFYFLAYSCHYLFIIYPSGAFDYRICAGKSGVNPNKAFVQHALECFLGFSIPEGEEEGFVFLQGDLVRATTISYDILLKDSQSIWNDICDIPDVEIPHQT